MMIAVKVKSGCGFTMVEVKDGAGYMTRASWHDTDKEMDKKDATVTCQGASDSLSRLWLTRRILPRSYVPSISVQKHEKILESISLIPCKSINIV